MTCAMRLCIRTVWSVSLVCKNAFGVQESKKDITKTVSIVKTMENLPDVSSQLIQLLI